MPAQTNSAPVSVTELAGSLQWIRADVESNLQAARHALETFIADPSEPAPLNRSVELLREVGGAMTMVELRGVARLLEEMASLGALLARADEETQRSGCALLMRGIAQLPNYLEFVASSHADAPVLLLPLLNEMREARGAPELSPVNLFQPDLWCPIPQLVAATRPDDQTLRNQAKQFRLLFQKGLIGWLKGAPAREGVGLVAAVIHRIVQLVGNSEARRLWWVAMGLSGALQLGEVQASASIKRMMSGLDRQLKRMVEEGLPALDRRPPENLLRALLFVCASTSRADGPLRQIRETFSLEQHLVNPVSREAAEQTLKGPNLEALQRVAESLRDDLDWVMDAVDTLVRSGEAPPEGFDSLAAPLKRGATVFGMLGLEDSQAQVLRVVRSIELLNVDDIGNDEVLLPIAGGLLEIDSTLDVLRTQGLEHTFSVLKRAEPHAMGGLGALESLSLIEAVCAEARTDLNTIKDAISVYVIEPEHFDVLEDVPSRMHSVAGALAILSLNDAQALALEWARFFERQFFEVRDLPSAQTLDALAEAVVSLEYYLESFVNGRAGAPDVLAGANSAVEHLRSVWPDAPDEPEFVSAVSTDEPDSSEAPSVSSELVADLEQVKGVLDRLDDSLRAPIETAFVDAAADAPASRVADAPPAFETTDPEIVAVFMEEAAEVAQTLEAHLPRWENDPNDSEALITIRRGFHTLKGSGRIIGAERIGDFAWAIERMLNRVIEGRIEPSANVRALVRDAYHSLPDLIEELRSTGSPRVTVEPMIAAAEVLAEGGVPNAWLPGDALVAPIAPPTIDVGRDVDARSESFVLAPSTPSLIEVFCDEAEGHLAVLTALCDFSRSHGAPVGLQPAVRACHTLTGSARAASLDDIARICSALEELLLQLSDSSPETPGPLSDAAVDLVGDAASEIEGAVQRLRVREDDLELPGAGQLVARMSVLGASLPVEVAPEVSTGETLAPVTTTDDDAEGLDQIFFEEARDILEANDHIIERWRDAHGDMAMVEELQRQLHTLKGGARLANATPIGDLAHAVESLLYMVGEGLSPVGERLIELIERAQDRLRLMLTQRRSGLEVADPEDLIARIDGFVSPGVDGAGTAAAPNPASMSLELERESTERSRVQVHAELLEELASYAGEISIAQNRTERYVGQFKQNLEEMEQTVQRLHDQLRRLEIETESQILFRQQEVRESAPGQFDPLELDRFSSVQELSRALAESVADLTSIQAFLEELTRDSESILAEQSRASNDLQHGLMQTRMLPFSENVPRFRRIVRQTAHELGKSVELDVSGAETRLDRNILERMLAPLEHMLRNAIDHGVEAPAERRELDKSESGLIAVTLSREVNEVVIRVSDDGRGLDREAIRNRAIARGLLAESAAVSDEELFQFVLEPAFSTADEITQISGRGVGMDVVNTEIKQLGGSLHIDSDPGLGTQFTIRLPFTLAINQALLVSVGGDTLAIPLLNVEGVMRISPDELGELTRLSHPTCTYSGFNYPLARLSEILALEAADRLLTEQNRWPVICIKVGEQRLALLVDELSGRQEVVVKPIGPQLSSIKWFSGATILGDGRVVLVLDVAALVRTEYAQTRAVAARTPPPIVAPEDEKNRLIMVVDDSITVRKVTGRFLSRNGMTVLTAKDGLEALAMLREQRPDLMLLDIEMPRMDGFELATTIRNDPTLSDLPIVMITSRTGKKHSERARQIGVNRYLGKPYQEGELLETIRELV
ncbi:MAG: Hpt domain-containing protein [Pseudomonadota bacterium]